MIMELISSFPDKLGFKLGSIKTCFETIAFRVAKTCFEFEFLRGNILTT